MKEIDRRQLTTEQVAMLDQYEAAQKQMESLKNIASTLQVVAIAFNEASRSNKDASKDFGGMVEGMSKALDNLKAIKAPDIPDYAKPVVTAVGKLEKALTSSLEKLDTEVKVDAPQVSVQAPDVHVPEVDLSGVQKILKTDIPKAFEKAVKLIPKTEIPDADFSPLVDKLDSMLEQLADIDKGVRLKPLPGSMKISNLGDETLPVSQQAATAPTQTTLQNNAVANGNGEYLDVEGHATALIHIISSTAMSGGTTVNFEASVDATTWTAVTAHQMGTSTLATTTTSDGDFRVSVVGFKKLRARISAYSAGMTTIRGYASPLAASPTALTASIDATGLATSAKQDTGNTSLDAIKTAVETIDNIVSGAGANITQLGGTNIDTNSGTKSAGTQRVILATDQPALTNKLLVTPDSVALPANQSVNQAQVAGTTTDTNSGTKSAGTQRVVIATDQPQLTNKLLVTPDANSAVNVAQINGVTTTMNNGVAGTGVQRVTIASDSTGQIIALGNVASAATDSGNPVKIGGKYNSAAPTLTDGQRGDVQLDVNANQKVSLATLIAGEDLTANVQGVIQKPITGSTYAPSTYKDAASVTKANIKASAGNVYYIRITNANAAVRYFQLHNKATAPAAADTAQQYWLVPAGTATAPGVLELGINELAPSEYFATGIGWAISTVAATFTDSATAGDHFAYVRYA